VAGTGDRAAVLVTSTKQQCMHHYNRLQLLRPMLSNITHGGEIPGPNCSIYQRFSVTSLPEICDRKDPMNNGHIRIWKGAVMVFLSSVCRDGEGTRNSNISAGNLEAIRTAYLPNAIDALHISTSGFSLIYRYSIL
jgi:hypothetical protein